MWKKFWLFLNTFLSNRAKAIENIRAVINEDTGLYDASGKDLFYGDFRALQDILATILIRQQLCLQTSSMLYSILTEMRTSLA